MRVPLRCLHLVVSSFLALGQALSVSAQSATSTNILLHDVLVLRSVGRAGRSAVHTDAVESELVAGTWRPPMAGQTVKGPRGDQEWESLTADAEGALPQSASRGGYVYWAVPSDREQIMVLEASGHGAVYVNGVVRAGDPYGYGYVHLPVLLRTGTNDFLFQGLRGRFKARLTTPSSGLIMETADSTLPDIVMGEREPLWGAVMLLNATTNSVSVTLRAIKPHSRENSVSIPPLGVRKAPFQLGAISVKESGSCPVELEATSGEAKARTRATGHVTMRIRKPTETCKRTFISSIDDSVQYYAVNPESQSSGFPRQTAGPHGSDAHSSGLGQCGPALFLSLHGASVEAIGQADAYSPKRWGYIVCPTNRRPYGFDWEDWGRLDALEVLELACGRYRPDPSRIYLTGHSMGGHGTWQLGALFPDRFAAIGPSAGWVSFTSYVETNNLPATNGVQAILRRAAAASDTLLMATNYLQEGVYILHGDADDNVPVREARHMREVLSQFHRDYDFHEQPGAGHWWDASDEPGADCVDWAPMYDFFARHAIPGDEEVRQVRFVTINPAVSARSHWVTVASQQHDLLPSAVDLRCDPQKRRVVGTTTNVARLWVEFPAIAPGQPVSLDLDGQKLENVPWPTAAANAGKPGLWVELENGRWQLGRAPLAAEKNPARSGPFRHAFANHVVLVYATQGTVQENAWALARARYDSEAFWYRSNGSLQVESDQAYLLGSAKRGRGGKARENVILYGNGDNNAAWPVLLAHSPVQVHRVALKVGDREIAGEDLACLFLQPYPGDDRALVGVVAGTGLPGLHLTERLPYFLSGAGFPDCLVVGTDMLTKGIDGVRAAGFFGPDWSAAKGEFEWRE